MFFDVHPIYNKTWSIVPVQNLTTCHQAVERHQIAPKSHQISKIKLGNHTWTGPHPSHKAVCFFVFDKTNNTERENLNDGSVIVKCNDKLVPCGV